jgi:hypothetical protein
MKIGLLVILLSGAIILLSSCRTAGPSSTQTYSQHQAHSDAMENKPRPFYPPTAPSPNFKVRRY